jgi:F-box and WD-40 domain protein CDC4
MPTPAADFDQQLTGSPPPPPTPAASPGPSNCQPDWSGAADDEDFFLAKVRQHFKNSSGPQRTRILADLLNLCTSPQLSFVHQFVSPLLKKDPFTSLPNELCLRVGIDASTSEEVMLTKGRSFHSLTTPKYWPEPRKCHIDGVTS